MTDGKKLCVIIPVHKEHISNEEKISLLACYRHLKNYDCFLVFPEGMKISAYLKIHPNLILKPVPALWLAAIESYNRMKTSAKFYSLFNTYEFMMTYELDAYIFNSKIEEHFGYEFDFIGAPVFLNDTSSNDGGLNSGFSIRKIKAGISAIEALKKFKIKWKWLRFIYWNVPLAKKLLNAHQQMLTKDGYLKAYYHGGYFHEDYIFTQIVPKIFPAFKIAPAEKAMQFSFEMHSDVLYKMNDEKLPLGCHAFGKNMYFWKDFIKI